MRVCASSLRVCLDARVADGSCGGVQQVVIGLASGLASLSDGSEEYLFLTLSGADEWLRPHMRGPCRLLPGPRPTAVRRWRNYLLRRVPALRRGWQALRAAMPSSIQVPPSDGTIERAGVEVMHFTTQSGFLTDVPCIYQPHDLQHLHWPQFFSARDYSTREVAYRKLCDRASLVCMMTTWGKDDLIAHYGLAESKVAVVPWAPVLSAYPTPSQEHIVEAQNALHLPAQFAYYPAQTWPHKNHLALLEALAMLRERDGIIVPLVCSGWLNHEFLPAIQKRMRELRLTDQVRFLGFVSPLHVRCLYALCRIMVFPSLFEGWGMPILEAFSAGVPVACSNVTSLPALAGGAALLFDPTKPEEIAAAVRRLWVDRELREELQRRGRDRAALFSWERTARIFRAHYRRIAGRPLTDEDRQLLAAPPLV